MKICHSFALTDRQTDRQPEKTFKYQCDPLDSFTEQNGTEQNNSIQYNRIHLYYLPKCPTSPPSWRVSPAPSRNLLVSQSLPINPLHLSSPRAPSVAPSLRDVSGEQSICTADTLPTRVSSMQRLDISVVISTTLVTAPSAVERQAVRRDPHHSHLTMTNNYRR